MRNQQILKKDSFPRSLVGGACLFLLLVRPALGGRDIVIIESPLPVGYTIQNDSQIPVHISISRDARNWANMTIPPEDSVDISCSTYIVKIQTRGRRPSEYVIDCDRSTRYAVGFHRRLGQWVVLSLRRGG